MLKLDWETMTRVNTMTKYPSIPTYHTLDPKDGSLSEAHIKFADDDLVIGTEKVDGVNARIILLPRDGLWVIGSRDELLAGRFDLVPNQALGIVDALRPIADSKLDWIEPSEFLVFYVEVYGDRRMPAWKKYGTGNTIGVRLFDIGRFTDVYEETLGWDIERIASWRERGGQPFEDESTLEKIADQSRLELTPRLFKGMGVDIPETIDGMWEMINKYSTTQVATDLTPLPLSSEGFVLRTPDRRTIAKVRRQSYSRTLSMRG